MADKLTSRALQLTKKFVEDTAESWFINDRDLRLTRYTLTEFPRFIHNDIYEPLHKAFPKQAEFSKIIDAALKASATYATAWVKANLARWQALPPVVFHKRLQVGTILVNSIGSGCDSFYEITKRTPNSVQARLLEDRYVSNGPQTQSGKSTPIPGKFVSGLNAETVTLRLHPNGDIGPAKRMMWWNLWDGQPSEQYSS